jgi:hypothetical protein
MGCTVPWSGGRALYGFERQPRESAATHARVSAASHSRLFNRSRVQEHWLLATVPLSRPGFRPFHFPFTRCFNSSNQCSTTTMLAGVAFGAPSALFLIIRNR